MINKLKRIRYISISLLGMISIELVPVPIDVFDTILDIN